MSSLTFLAQINRGFGWVTIAETTLYTSAQTIGWEYSIEHDCDFRVQKEVAS